MHTDNPGRSIPEIMSMGFHFHHRLTISRERTRSPETTRLVPGEYGASGIMDRSRSEAMDTALLRLLRHLANCGLDAAAQPLLKTR